MRVAVITGGPSNEHDVSVASGKMVLKELDKKKFFSREVRIQKNGSWKFLPGTKAHKLLDAIKILRNGFDVAFIGLHGKFGEDGTLQAYLEGIGMPYTGSGMATSALAMNKHLSNALLKLSGLSVPPYTTVSKKNVIKHVRYPVVIKPLRGGSSLGVSIVRKKADFQKALRAAFREDSEIMIQKYIAGRELTCGVLEVNGDPIPLTPTEIIPLHSKFFDYQAKYTIKGSQEITPPNLSKSWIRRIQNAALIAHKVFACKGMSRTDFIMAGKHLYTIEINTLPGMTPTSLLPQAAKHDGISFKKMLELIVHSAIQS